MKLLDLCRSEGLLIGKGGLWGQVVRIAPPLTLTIAEADELLSKLRNAFESLAKLP